MQSLTIDTVSFSATMHMTVFSQQLPSLFQLARTLLNVEVLCFAYDFCKDLSTDHECVDKANEPRAWNLAMSCIVSRHDKPQHAHSQFCIANARSAIGHRQKLITGLMINKPQPYVNALGPVASAADDSSYRLGYSKK